VIPIFIEPSLSACIAQRAIRVDFPQSGSALTAMERRTEEVMCWQTLF
jgi:hypothetical protein